jgi:flagellar biosynthesis protein FliR
VHLGLHVFVVSPGRVEVGIFVVFLELLLLLLFFVVERHHFLLSLLIDDGLSNRGARSFLLQLDDELLLFILTEHFVEVFAGGTLLAYDPNGGVISG